jgi:hypothetical protein
MELLLRNLKKNGHWGKSTSTLYYNTEIDIREVGRNGVGQDRDKCQAAVNAV